MRIIGSKAIAFKFLLRLPNCLPKGCHQFSLPPTEEERANFFILALIGTTHLFQFEHSNEWEICHCFDVHFPDYCCGSASFHTFIGHLGFFFFWELPLWFSCAFFSTGLSFLFDIKKLSTYPVHSSFAYEMCYKYFLPVCHLSLIIYLCYFLVCRNDYFYKVNTALFLTF